MISTVPKIWPNATVAILAGGPSLRTQDLTPLHADAQVKIVTVNDSWRLLRRFKIATSKLLSCGQCEGTGGAPNYLCTMCSGTGSLSSAASYFSDASWWHQAMAANKRSEDNAYSFHDAIYKCWWFTGSRDFADHPQVNSLLLTGQTGLEGDRDGLRHGSNSGYAAINLAVHLGAKKIILLGFDMRFDKGRSNWHDEPRAFASPDLYKQSMLPCFDTLVDPLEQFDVNVVNATPDSALNTFTKRSLEDALNE